MAVAVSNRYTEENFGAGGIVEIRLTKTIGNDGSRQSYAEEAMLGFTLTGDCGKRALA